MRAHKVRVSFFSLQKKYHATVPDPDPRRLAKLFSIYRYFPTVPQLSVTAISIRIRIQVSIKKSGWFFPSSKENENISLENTEFKFLFIYVRPH
jgi:hypothetical protein